MIFRTLVLGPFVNNVYLLGDEKAGEGAIVDASFGAEKIVEQARKLGLTWKALVLTHGHLDHVVGAGKVREALGAPILIHEGDRWLYENVETQAQMFGFGVSKLPPPDRFLTEGEEVGFGRYTLRVVHTPGHTPGSICLTGEAEGGPAVFTGDTLFQGSIGRTDLWGGDPDQELASIRIRLLSLPGTTVALPGHGEATTIEAEARSNPFLV